MWPLRIFRTGDELRLTFDDGASILLAPCPRKACYLCRSPTQPAGTVIGAPGTFRATHYGDVLAWELPGTGIRGSVSHKLFRRPDPSRDAELSLRPDVVLPPT